MREWWLLWVKAIEGFESRFVLAISQWGAVFCVLLVSALTIYHMEVGAFFMLSPICGNKWKLLLVISGKVPTYHQYYVLTCNVVASTRDSMNG